MKKFLFAMLLICASFTLFTACDEPSGDSSGDTPPTETVYTKVFTNKDGTYMYKLTTTDGTYGTLDLYDESENQLLSVTGPSTQNGAYIFGGEGNSYTTSVTISGETFEFDGLSNYPGIVMPYADIAGTYSVLNYDGTVAEQTITFNADGTGTLNDGSNSVSFECYTMDGNRAIIFSDELSGEYIEFSEQGVKHLGSVYAPCDYVYFSSTEYNAGLPYETLKSQYGVEHLGVVGTSTLFYNDNGAYRIDRGNYKYYGTDEYVEVENIFFGKTVFDGDEFTFTCQNKDGYGYEMEKSVVDDKHYVTVKYEKVTNEFGEACFDYEHTGIKTDKAVWNDYYFGKSYYSYRLNADDGYSAEGDTKDFDDGYKTLMYIEESTWGYEIVHDCTYYVVHPTTLELKYILIDHANITYDGLYDETILNRASVNGVVQQNASPKLLIKTSEDVANEKHGGYIYSCISDEMPVYEKLGRYSDIGEDSFIYYSGTYEDYMYANLEGYLLVDKEEGTYKTIETGSECNLDEYVAQATHDGQTGTYYYANANADLSYNGAVVFNYNNGEKAYLFLYSFATLEPIAYIEAYDCEYTYIESADGDEITFKSSWDGNITTIVIKLTTGEPKAIASITFR